MTIKQTERINKLSELKAKGHITEEEFLTQQNKILREVNINSFLTRKNIKNASIFGAIIFFLWFLIEFRSPSFENEIQAVCQCYNEAKNLPAKEPDCALLKNKLEERVSTDSLGKVIFNKLIQDCANYPR